VEKVYGNVTIRENHMDLKAYEQAKAILVGRGTDRAAMTVNGKRE
jgi:hypothetical protein